MAGTVTLKERAEGLTAAIERVSVHRAGLVRALFAEGRDVIHRLRSGSRRGRYRRIRSDLRDAMVRLVRRWRASLGDPRPAVRSGGRYQLPRRDNP